MVFSVMKNKEKGKREEKENQKEETRTPQKNVCCNP
jgi:hypothetical protein